ncbi:hypothetical protein P3745_24300 [Vibrio parahaemolyticus]|uniref:hypothetical protein n=1 Tax=Vibrio parahaemolyticus TaxID=670 RepID=UPI001B82B91B|nr:hypothetical protein [Vibrio parahaemolyticus]ELA8098863.1 hypothetical protein [Vibrio parahaemolyticus]MDF4345714.1 hypothetical protein [Vibrio parahaemolyticus]MDF4359652.1 hypothetical protein [Vibrio parahaemolyticus]MDF4419641.1 hypothetical protein [Vibrio parahaemolyticus]MDF4527495.1 hypothetical protein [Vibrio parahaemolyticus]
MNIIDFIQTSNINPGDTNHPTSEQLSYLHDKHNFVLDGYYPIDKGKTTRWKLPIKVCTNGIKRAQKALDMITRKSGISNLFMVVDYEPESGIIFHDGGARGFNNVVNKDVTGNVSRLSKPSCEIWYTVDREGYLNGQYHIKLGSHDHLNGTKDWYYLSFWNHSKIAIHELTHALGFFDHYQSFGNTAVFHKDVYKAIQLLYSAPNKVDAQELTRHLRVIHNA